MKNALTARGLLVYPICAPIGDGVSDLMKKTAELVRNLPVTLLSEPVTDETIYRFEADSLFRIERDGKQFVVTGNWIAGLVNSTNFDDTESLQYFQRLLRKKGVIAALEKAGVVEGDLIKLHDAEFEFIF